MEPGVRVAGRYEVVRELGRGATAIVYLVRDLKFGADVALKVAAARHAGDHDEFRARFVREARIGFLLGRKEGFVRALDWGELPGGDLYLATDLVDGAVPLDLRAGLRAPPLRLAVLCQAAALVGAAHAQGIVHRDVKPANFLVSAAGVVHLMDFGLAKVLGDRSDEQEVSGYTLRTGREAYLGTPQFMPPEQFAGASDVDARADVYALGVMLFHALTGQYPYAGKSGVELLVKQLAVRNGQEPPARARDVDPRIEPALDDVCAAALALDADARLQSTDELLRRLAPFVPPEQRLRVPPPMLAAMQQAAARRPAAAHAPTAPPGAPAPQAPPGAAPAPAPPAAPSVSVDLDGFVAAEALRDVLRAGGSLRGVVGRAALRVQDERPLQGRTRFLGRIAPLRSRSGAAEVVVGRSRQRADIVFELPTVSNRQLTFVERQGGWTVSEEGSRNGSELNGVALTPGAPRPIADGDVLHLSKHVTLAFHTLESLERWLRSA